MSIDLSLGVPRLPPELEREIFEIADQIGSQGEPFLYRAVFLQSVHIREQLHNLSLLNFAMGGQDDERSHMCLRHVRHLCVDSETERKNWLTCTGVTNLSAQFRHARDPRFTGVIYLQSTSMHFAVPASRSRWSLP
ncbi:hypothetical protein C8R45DRAFT_1108535 [Mycena sanguinolenta]|nr:hypothetical protein C8R45DRAFT_1108535 [Mycena sanguinolenta]